LQAIGDLCLGLPAEAAQKGVQSEAMMLLGPVADPAEWSRATTAAIFEQVRLETAGEPIPVALTAYLADCRDEMHPLFVLGSWEEVWREHLDHRTDRRITVESAVAYLDMQIGYMTDQVDPPFDEFARELRQCRGHLEDVLRDGIREERSQVPCVECETRLTRVYGDKESDDRWLCPRCRRTYSDEEYARAQHFHLEHERADRFVKVSEALGMIDRPEQTLRTWMRVGHVRTMRDPKGPILVWWPDVRTMNLNTKRRTRTGEPTYGGTHQRVRRLVGSASEQRCVDCGGQAQHWSYDHNASSNELLDERGYAFATDLSHYSPRCVTCHARFDSESA
jgi:hypothetical protein